MLIRAAVVVLAALPLAVARLAIVVVRVRGESMLPSLRPGDHAVVLRHRYLRRLRPGDVVVCRYPGGRWPAPEDAAPYLIKRVAAVEGQPLAPAGRPGRVPARHVVLLGEHEPSFDSRQFGPVPRADVLGRVLAVLPA